MHGPTVSSFGIAFLALLQTLAQADDWPQYRGPNHDGFSREQIRLNWTEEPPRQLWRKTMDPGLSSFSISGGKAFTQVRRLNGSAQTEFCVALNADTGEELWAVPLDQASYPHGGVGSDDGPRSTPCIDGDRVYVFTSYLRLYCLNANSGQTIWMKDFVADLGSTVVAWQNAASPVIVGDLIFVNGNATNQRLMAVRKSDGAIVWKGQNDRMTQATPVYGVVAGVPQVIFFAQSGLVSVEPETGRVLWRYSLPFSTSTAASPVIAGDTVYASAAYGVGAGMVRISKSGLTVTSSQVWRTPGANMNHWATPVFYEGHFYGIYGQSLVSLRCVEASSGVEKWRQDGVGTGGLLRVSDHLLVLTANGTLIVVQPDPAQYREITRFRAVTTGKAWNVPAISHGRIYVRSTLQAAAFDVSLPPPPAKPLKLQPALSTDAKVFQLKIAAEDGSALDAAQAGKIEIHVSSDLSGENWTRLETNPVLNNGVLQIDEPIGAAPKFYRTVQKP
ncbi:MAG: PQQ-binding-like beta-propeller repeat protein [Verrucomicrobiota bacterium]